MQLTFTFQENATPREIAASLRFRAGIFEGQSPKEAASDTNTQVSDERTSKRAATRTSDIENDFGPVSTDTTASTDSWDMDDFTDTVPAKKATTTTPATKTKAAPKKKTTTLDDVNNACKAKAKEITTAGGDGRAEVKKVLKKQFKVASVQELTEDQFDDVVSAVKDLEAE